MRINDLRVPEIFELGASDSILLDCDFDYEDAEKFQLDIKWYFNGEPTPFVQWVPAQMERPQLIGDRFRGHVDLAHAVHEDVFKRHRALRLVHPTLELAGTYTCKVSTFLDEDVKQKKMVIYCECIFSEFRGYVRFPGLRSFVLLRNWDKKFSF